MNELGKRLLDITQNFLQHEDTAKAPVINDSYDVDEVTEKFDEVVDFVDRLIEKVDLYAEESAGGKPKTNIVISKPIHNAKADFHMFHSNNMERPQLKFADEIDNSSSPFIPKITHKPNAQVPLDPIILQGQNWAAQKNKSKIAPPNLGPGGFYPHPYDYELRTLQYLDSQLVSRPETIYKSLEDTPYTWIDSLSELKVLAKKLEHVEEIAIDLEAHAYRSFQGFVCLMQISTRQEDFIIDTLALRQHLHILNSSFTNPRIVKVLHGSDGDILWLQRDFGLYIVNLFDTGQASRVLEYPSFGLAYLLKFYCNVDADKKYQLADWRIRELPQEMIRYAREDTHYLLYIYDRLRNELISKGNPTNNLLLSVLNRSKELSGRRYEKERLDDVSHLMLYNKILPNHTTIFNALQMKVFAAVYAWRDNKAREQDESTRYVLPNHMMFEIAAQMPSEPVTLLSCCGPVPPLVRAHSDEIITLIKNTQKQQTQPVPLPQSQLAQSATTLTEASPPIARPTYFSNLPSFPQPQLPSKPESAAAHPAKAFGTPIANGYNTHTNTPSPVLTTEQLYRTAGWLTEDDPDRDSKQSNEDNTDMPSSPVTPRSRRKAILAKASTGVLFSAQSSSESESEDEAKRAAALIRSSFSNIVSANFPTFSSLVAPAASIAKPAAPAKQDDEADGDDESENKEKDTTSSDETKQPSADGTPSKKVPRSMAEIYKLSNQNRKRNKEKKKLKEDSLNTHPSSPVVLEDSETSPISRNKKQKTNHAKRDTEKEDKKDKEDKEGAPTDEGEDTVEFMKEIGWITKSAEAKSQATTTATTSNNNNNINTTASTGSNASGSGDVKSSTSHTSKPHPNSSSSTSSSHHDTISSSPPRNKSSKQQAPPHSPKQSRQPQQHISKPHHPNNNTNNNNNNNNTGPTTGHSGVPLPNFSAFDYSAAPSFGLVPGQAPTSSQFYNPGLANVPNATGQTRLNPLAGNTRRAAPSATFRTNNNNQGRR